MFTYPKPSCEQNTLASVSLKPSLQTAPHVPLYKTSKRPLCATPLPASLTEQRRKHNYIGYTYYVFIKILKWV